MVAENPRVPLGDFAVAVDAVGCVEEGVGAGIEIEGIGSCLVPLRQMYAASPSKIILVSAS